MDDQTRHARFLYAQQECDLASVRYETATTPNARDRAERDVHVWAAVAQTLRRTT